MRLPFVVLIAVTPAFAQPKPAAKVPTRTVACAMDDIKLASTTRAEPLVCWDKGCMKLDFSSSAATWHVKPPPVKDWMLPTAEVKDTEVCLGATCKKLGKKLVAAIAEHKKARSEQPDPNDPVNLSATTDLKAVIVGGSKVFNVATDREIKFAMPKLYTREKPQHMSAEPAGSLLVLSWTACAGPCTKFSLADSSGRALGPEGEGGGSVFQLDAKRFVLASEYATIHVFDIATGKPRGTLSGLRGHPTQNQFVRGDDSTIFVMSPHNDGYVITQVSSYADIKGPPDWLGSMYLPKCTP